MTCEIWKPVLGFEGMYEVSNLGRVRSLDRSWKQRARSGVIHTHRHKGRVLRPGPSKTGHLSVILGRGKMRQVHALVLSAFVGPCPEGNEGIHLDGCPSNNRLENLKWGTRSENGRHKKWHSGQSTYRLTPDDVREIKSGLSDGAQGVALAKRFSVSPATISAIKHGRFHCDV